MSNLPHAVIYTDGACRGNPGPGGWAALVRFPKGEQALSGSKPSTTNNQMELTADIEALNTLQKPHRIDFYTDSEYLKRGITEWMPGWKARNWNRKKGILKNVSLWKALDAAIQEHKISWYWVRGHAGNTYNERVDQMARKAIK